MMSCTKHTVQRSCQGLYIPRPSKPLRTSGFVPLVDEFLCRDSSILPEELATQSVRLKEEQLRREEEKVRDEGDTCSKELTFLVSCGRLNCGFSARSTRNDKSF